MKQSISVGVVEDDPVFRESLVTVLADTSGMCVHHVAKDHQAACQMLQGPPLDVLLVDLDLPDGDGCDIIRAARASWPRCQIMVISVFSQEHKVIPALQAGAEGYLIKSGDLDAIREQIDRLIEGDVPVSAVVAQHMLRLVQSAASQPAPVVEVAPGPEPQASAAQAQPVQEPGLPLTPQQYEAMRLIAKGFTRAEVARHMGVSVDTVKTHIARAYLKLGVKSRTEALFELKMIRLSPSEQDEDAPDEAA